MEELHKFSPGAQPLLALEDFRAAFRVRGRRLAAVDGVNLTVRPGEIVGVAGESGSGKSVMAQSILRLVEYDSDITYSGKISFEGEDLLKKPRSRLGAIRGNRISMIFQDPLTSLNPVYTVGRQIDEVLRLHRGLSGAEARRRTLELLDRTGIPSPRRCAGQYPHELSGGMQQRVMIAMALACEPSLLIADEPTTALDVTIQDQILGMISDLNRETGMAVLLITHDLNVMARVCHSVRVMYLGQIVEEAETGALFARPLHPYTQGLLACIPRLDVPRDEPLPVIPGIVPPLSAVPAGCRFCTRCPYADGRCRAEEPPAVEAGPGHYVKCWRFVAGDEEGRL